VEIIDIIAIVSAFGVIGALIFNVHNLRRDIMLRNATMITEFNKELGKMFKEETSLVSKEQCENYIMRYLDALRRVYFLYKHKKIPKEMTGFFNAYFSYGKELVNCYTKVEPNDEFDKYFNEMIKEWLAIKHKKWLGIKHKPPEEIGPPKKLAKSITTYFASLDSPNDDSKME